MKKLILLLSIILIPSSSFSQVQVGPTAKMVFNAPTGATTVAQALSFTYKHYIDNTTTGTTFVPTCSIVLLNVECESPLPALTVGNHSIQITATNVAGESLKVPVPALSFTVLAVPVFQSNGNFRLVITPAP
jgi:hypothetical protein